MTISTPSPPLELPEAEDAEAVRSRFRRTAGRFPTGVTVVTTQLGSDPHGSTVNSFASVSMDPLMVLIALGHDSRTHDRITTCGSFAVTVLATEDEDVARWFASSSRPDGRVAFDGVRHRPAAFSGAPVLLDGVAYFDCVVTAAHRAGDHTVFIGGVRDFGVLQEGPPLVFADSSFS